MTVYDLDSSWLVLEDGFLFCVAYSDDNVVGWSILIALSFFCRILKLEI